MVNKQSKNTTTLLASNAITLLTCIYLISCLRSLRRDVGAIIQEEEALAAQQNAPKDYSQVQTVFVITPTYERRTQRADLTRVSQALQCAEKYVHIHWILVEDSKQQSMLVENVLLASGLSYTHLNKKEEHIAHKFRAGDVRNEGIRYIRRLDPPPHPDSVVYFADDDNAYDARLFNEIKQVRQVGVWPVAYSGGRRVEFPVVKEGKISGFKAYKIDRKFPLDMAGFAVNIKFFLKPDPLLFTVNAPATTGETRFLEDTGLTRRDLEPLANNCTMLYVWHIKTRPPSILANTDPGAHIVEV
eukprot:m.112794 g.112794  ORF g.112794 m.112794 type:complete len:301 (+) comp22844_c0_seq4:90-992(+)